LFWVIAFIKESSLFILDSAVSASASLPEEISASASLFCKKSDFQFSE